VHGLHAATSKVVNSAKGSSCKLKFVHGELLQKVCVLPCSVHASLEFECFLNKFMLPCSVHPQVQKSCCNIMPMVPCTVPYNVHACMLNVYLHAECILTCLVHAYILSD